MPNHDDIAFHYDEDSAFFKSVLGQSMAYSCARWEGKPDDSLIEAQRNKLDYMLDLCNFDSGKSLVDLGCGWGSIFERLIENGYHESRVTGITLSNAQAIWCQNRFSVFSGFKVVNGHVFEVLTYSDKRYDCGISIGAFEHFSTPAEFKKGKHIDRYADFFRLCRSRIDGSLALQTIVAQKNISQASQSERAQLISFLFFMSKSVFPNSLLPRVSDIEQAIKGIYKVARFELNSTEYARTLFLWRENLRAGKSKTPKVLLELYEKYFTRCIDQFEKGSLAISRWELQPDKEYNQ